jgi:DNA-binding HxlR family transcriptional regulator
LDAGGTRRAARKGQRCHDLDKALDGISHKVLTDTLRRAESNGLTLRELDPDRIETAMIYELTDLGRSLNESLATLERWAVRNWSQVESARLRWSQRTD